MKGIFIRLTLSFVMVLMAYSLGTSQRASPAKTATGTIEGVTITIDYSAPSVKGRKIWGGLVPYGSVWRTGANEATVFTASADVMVADKPLKAGKYGLFTIPGEKQWTIIFSPKWDTWGTSYTKMDNEVRVDVPFSTDGEMQEQLLFRVNADNVELAWEKGVVRIPVKKG